MKYINHDTERIRSSCVFVKEFNTKILNVRVCVSVLVTMSISSGGTTCSAALATVRSY